MFMNMFVKTCNEGKGGGFHEFHSINFLSSPVHAVATVENIIGLNLAHACKNSQLIKVEVETNHDAILKALYAWKQFFDTLENGVNIIVSKSCD